MQNDRHCRTRPLLSYQNVPVSQPEYRRTNNDNRINARAEQQRHRQDWTAIEARNHGVRIVLPCIELSSGKYDANHRDDNEQSSQAELTA